MSWLPSIPVFQKPVIHQEGKKCTNPSSWTNSSKKSVVEVLLSQIIYFSPGTVSLIWKRENSRNHHCSLYGCEPGGLGLADDGQEQDEEAGGGLHPATVDSPLSWGSRVCVCCVYLPSSQPPSFFRWHQGWILTTGPDKELYANNISCRITY